LIASNDPQESPNQVPKDGVLAQWKRNFQRSTALWKCRTCERLRRIFAHANPIEYILTLKDKSKYNILAEAICLCCQLTIENGLI
jgi:hypothetical protein